MLINYLKIAWRNIRKQKLHSYINIFGLAIGLAATLLIFSFVQHEMNYDKFNKDAENIYRFVSDLTRPNGQGSKMVININKVGPEIKSQFPQVEEMLRVKPGGSVNVDFEKEVYSEFNCLYVDSTFFNMFDYKLIRGSSESAMADPKGMVISKEVADKIFKDKDPIGETLEITQQTFRVTGVMENFPSQSHLQYDILLPLKAHPYYDHLGGMEFVTYIKIDEKSDNSKTREQICQKADELVNERFKGSGYKAENSLQPLLDIHLKSTGFQYDYRTNGDIQKVYIYSFLALIILVVAVINYLNLFTARTEYRTKEVGLRKVMGAFRYDLIKQFLSESFLITIISFAIALGLVEIFIGKFGDLLGRNLSTGYFDDPVKLLYITLLVILVAVLSGYYPAFYLSRFNVIRVFRGGKKSSGQKNKLTVSLVVVQFIIAIFLISSVVIFNKQVRFMKSKDVGFNKEQVLVVKGMTKKLKESYEVVREKLLDNPKIKHVTTSQTIPGILNRSGQTIYETGKPESSGISVKENRVSYDYIETFGMEMKAGRSFSKDYSNESRHFIINETAQKELGLEDPVGKKISMRFIDGKIIGVVKDYNFASLQHGIAPTLLSMYNQEYNKFFFSMKIAPGDYSETIDYVEKSMKEIDSEYTMDYFFLNDHFENLYKSEERSTTLVSLATILAMILAFLGLFALTSFTIIKRTKEIGIRKVMGASPGIILKLLSSNMLKWIGVASLIAFPLIYYFMNNWLQEFAYRINIQVWMLIVPAIMAVVIALLTTSTLTLRAANTNPAETLRDE
jgi:putative ABC transport system permease protein